MYKFIRKFFFLFPPEPVHHFAMWFIEMKCKFGFSRAIWRAMLAPRKIVEQPYQALGLDFKNRVGLGAGFDKDAKYLRELDVMGFGFVEVGTVTPLAQYGNPKPRLFRLPKDKGLINRMGFNNEGVEAMVDRLKKWRKKNPVNENARMIIGGNIGKNKITPNEDAWLDYEKCFLALHDWVDFFVINVSSPNTPALRELQTKESLKKIIGNLQEKNKTFTLQKPILLKIAPDLSFEQIDEIVELAKEINLDGLVLTNTTISRENLKTNKQKVEEIGNGGLSGKPVQQRSTEVLKYIAEKTNNQIFLIASGGIFTADDVKEKFQHGASLAEVWTGFIYEGPAIMKKIYKKLK